jgi:hypothetical protein
MNLVARIGKFNHGKHCCEGDRYRNLALCIGVNVLSMQISKIGYCFSFSLMLDSLLHFLDREARLSCLKMRRTVCWGLNMLNPKFLGRGLGLVTDRLVKYVPQSIFGVRHRSDRDETSTLGFKIPWIDERNINHQLSPIWRKTWRLI